MSTAAASASMPAIKNDVKTQVAPAAKTEKVVATCNGCKQPEPKGHKWAIWCVKCKVVKYCSLLCKTKFYQAHRDSECTAFQKMKTDELANLTVVTARLSNGHIIYVSYTKGDSSEPDYKAFKMSVESGTARVLRHVCNSDLKHSTKVIRPTNLSDEFRLLMVQEARDATDYNRELFPWQSVSPRPVVLEGCRPTADEYEHLSKAFEEAYRIDASEAHVQRGGKSDILLKCGAVRMEWYYAVPYLYVKEKRPQIETLRKGLEDQTLMITLNEPEFKGGIAVEFQKANDPWYARWLGPKTAKDREVKEFLLQHARRPMTLNAGDNMLVNNAEYYLSRPKSEQLSLSRQAGDEDYQQFLNSPRIFDPSGERFKNLLKIADSLNNPTPAQQEAARNILMGFMAGLNATRVPVSSSAAAAAKSKPAAPKPSPRPASSATTTAAASAPPPPPPSPQPPAPNK